ncbi:MAG: NAD(+)/NADH kinase [Acidobacteria bacterium]|nr:MAG: NAD(+)/NADH kinase [Acidobacteriota bacterium]REK02994.1 MAG: NAD(+)/NADH kinase [Acidobacteriota bacterium]REK13202.1 MAG: NAD(+)/NADH kinase [Acidobacteriota bacterium]REK41196.1 MAG: NAD(+)/NADH kinase [Acidobacteriota bacterium]
MTERQISNAGIVVKPNHREAWASACELADWFEENGVRMVAKPRQEAEIAAPGSDDTEKFREADLIVVLGGDGTMISAARLIGENEPLVLGVNYGGLGYLTEQRIEEMIPAVEAVLAGDYKVERRVMLDAEHIRDGEMLASGRVLNDVVINKSALARIIEIEVELNDLHVNSFRADGLIVSTPTGSTAYNLSAGGPIVYPTMNAVVITPICPFTLTNRPIVMPDDSEINLKLNEGSEDVVLTLDGQIGYEMKALDSVRIRKSEMTFNMVQSPNRNYFDVLRNKLKWGR